MSSREITDLHPKLQPLCQEFLDRCAIAGLHIILTTTYRSNAEQDALYALGRTVKSHVGPWDEKHPLGRVVTRAKGGQSEHNHTIDGKPASLAFDIAILVSGKLIWDEASPLWELAGEIGMHLGLKWYGAPGAAFFELPHMAYSQEA